eukprot:9470201-Pyramimonas_sp.AAC.1
MGMGGHEGEEGWTDTMTIRDVGVTTPGGRNQHVVVMCGPMGPRRSPLSPPPLSAPSPSIFIFLLVPLTLTRRSFNP